MATPTGSCPARSRARLNRISRVLSRHITSVGRPLRNTSSFLRSVKDHLGLKTTGVYSISCEYGQVYIGQTGRSSDTRLKEHQRHVRLEHPDKSAVAEHSINLGHDIHLYDTAILSTKPGHVDRIVREAIEIGLHNNNVNREDGFCLSKSWKPPISSLRDRSKPPSHESRYGFFAGPKRSAHTALIRAKKYALSGHPPASTLMSRLISATSAPSSPTACLRLPYLTSLPSTSAPSPTHPYTFQVFFS
jgi:hypothetical protein